MSAAPTLAADLAIAPGGTIGIVGAGQLGRMMALAARSLGYRVHVLTGETEPGTDTPAGPVSDRQVHGSFSDELVLQEFVAGVDIVTFEFENVDTAVDDVAAQHDVPVRPGGRAVRVAQHRGREKDFLTRAAIPVAPYVVARSAAELAEAIDHLGGLVIAKTAAFGYDGKGQVRIAEASQAAAAWTALGVDEVVVESVVPFVVEVSVVVARSITGETADYGPIENRHVDGILDTSAWPSCLAAEVAERARSLARSVARALDYVGILAVEMFVLADHSVLVNEIAPRPAQFGSPDHRSGSDEPVRATCPGGVRPAARQHGDASGGHGEPARRHLGVRPTPVEQRPGRSCRAPAPLREVPGAARPQDGAPDRSGRIGRRCSGPVHDRPVRPQPIPTRSWRGYAPARRWRRPAGEQKVMTHVQR